jgi:hypothetical protein
MQTGNINQFLIWGYGSIGVHHEVTGENPAYGRIPTEDELDLLEESEVL